MEQNKLRKYISENSYCWSLGESERDATGNKTIEENMTDLRGVEEELQKLKKKKRTTGSKKARMQWFVEGGKY